MNAVNRKRISPLQQGESKARQLIGRVGKAVDAALLRVGESLVNSDNRLGLAIGIGLGIGLLGFIVGFFVGSYVAAFGVAVLCVAVVLAIL